MKIRRTFGLIISLALALTMLGAASGPAAAVTSFGAALTTNTQPSNCCPPHTCAQIGQCTWVLNTALGGASTAPQDGTVHKVRIIAGQAGHFRLFVAQVQNQANLKAKVVFKGPKIFFNGQPDSNAPYVIESFNVSIPVHTGDRIAVRAGTGGVSALRCDQGSPHTLLFQPSLVVGGTFQTRQDDTGCWLLVQFQY